MYNQVQTNAQVILMGVRLRLSMSTHNRGYTTKESRIIKTPSGLYVRSPVDLCFLIYYTY